VVTDSTPDFLYPATWLTAGLAFLAGTCNARMRSADDTGVVAAAGP